MTVNEKPSVTAARDLVIKYLYDGRTSLNDDIRIHGPVYSGYNSHIFKINCSLLQHPCALKFCLKSGTVEADPATARQQFNTLEKVAKTMNVNRRYRVASPRVLMESDGALLIEWIEGKRVSDILSGLSRFPRHAQLMVEHSATWLNEFHSGHWQSPGTLNTEAKVPLIQEIQVRGTIKGKLIDNARQILLESAHAAQSITLPRSWVHGDFKADNLIITGDTVFGVDIHARRDGVVISDIAQFLNYLELYLVGWRHPQLRFHKRRLFRHFMTSYVQADFNSWRHWKLPLAWMRLYMLLHAWSDTSAQKQNPLLQFIIERRYSAPIARACRDLRGLSSI